VNNPKLLFKSSLAGEIINFINFKRSQEFDYRTEEYFFREFDDFLYSENYSSDILSQVIVDKYLSTKTTIRAKTKSNYFSMLSGFSKYLNTFKAESWICNYTIPHPRQVRYYIYTQSEVNNILATARSLSTNDPVIADCVAFIIGLLYCTGLRINEALQLQLDDIDFNNQTLFISKGKFRKSRYIVLDSTVVVQLKKWLKLRGKYLSELSEERLFINSKGKKIRDHTVRWFFHRIIRKTKIGEAAGTVTRLHDFRHTYACNCIETWRQQGADVNVKLPILSTAMGHVNIQSTQIYMHVTATNLHDAAERFHNKIFKS
jgi:integrase